MVCFIDDDLVCEAYSVSEEIHLLKNREEALMPGLTSELNSQHHGVVLDLHANPQVRICVRYVYVMCTV